MRKMRNVFRILENLNERPLGGPRRRWENNIKIDHKDI
jgi:hypothetical protein